MINGRETPDGRPFRTCFRESKCANEVSAHPGTLAYMIHRAFLRLDSASHEDMLTDAAVHVLAAHGALGLSAKAVAAWLRVTPQRVSQMANREHLVLVVPARFANRWLDWIAERRWRERLWRDYA